MSEKTKLQAVLPEPITAADLDPFAPDNLRLNVAFTDASVERILNVVPVRRPSPQDWCRVHPSPDYCGDFAMIELKDDREEFIVTSSLQAALAGEVVNKTLHLAQNRQGV